MSGSTEQVFKETDNLLLIRAQSLPLPDLIHFGFFPVFRVYFEFSSLEKVLKNIKPIKYLFKPVAAESASFVSPSKIVFSHLNC